VSTNRHAPFPLSQIMMSSLLFMMVLSVFTCWFHNMVYLTFMTCSSRFGYMLIPV
jgi:hypothetical protein